MFTCWQSRRTISWRWRNDFNGIWRRISSFSSS